MTRPPRIAVLGYGFIGDMHTRAVQANGFDVDVVSGHHHDRARAFADRHGIKNCTTEWQSVVTDPAIDVVVIGTPNALHFPQAMAAISCGKHVLIDKPMAMNVDQATQIVDAANRAGVTLLVGHMWRYRDEVVAMRNRISAGGIGRVVRTRGYGVHAGWGPSGWFVDPKLAGGGALIDMGIHAIDTARYLLGDPTAERVSASIGTAYGDYDVDDDGVVTIDWSNGVRSVVECGWWQPRLDGVEADTELYGSHGYSRIWPQFTPATPAPADYVHCSLPMYTAQMADFFHCCATGETPRASGSVGLEALRVVEMAYQSAGIAHAQPPA